MLRDQKKCCLILDRLQRWGLPDAHDNNAAERAISPFAIGRKNWLFMGNPNGAKAGAIIYSLIETAKANGVEPYKYLKYVLETIPSIETQNLSSLLPWNVPADVRGISPVGPHI